MENTFDKTKVLEEIANRKAKLSEKSGKLGEKDYNRTVKEPADKFLHKLAVSVNFGQQNEATQHVKQLVETVDNLKVDGSLGALSVSKKQPVVYEPRPQETRQNKQNVNEDNIPKQNNASLTDLLDGGVNKILSPNSRQNLYEENDRFPSNFAPKSVDLEVESYNKLMTLHLSDPEYYPNPPVMTESVRRKIENAKKQEKEQNQQKRQIIGENNGNYDHSSNNDLQSEIVDILVNNLGEAAGQALKSAIIDAFIEEKVLNILTNNSKVFESIIEKYLENNQEFVGKLLLDYIQKTKAKASR